MTEAAARRGGYTRGATEEGRLQTIELANDVVDALADRQAADVVLLDVQEYSGFADYFVVATSGSDRQMRALVEAVDSAADAYDQHPRWEGKHDEGWLLADLGDVIVHLLSMEQRARYDLEGLWQRAQEVVHIQ
ncbi:MAG: ribosome silencing factor [Chloroflexi bacterium]|nr:ribosome silencing factor [Chloroflexota bacterium]